MRYLFILLIFTALALPAHTVFAADLHEHREKRDHDAKPSNHAEKDADDDHGHDDEGEHGHGHDEEKTEIHSEQAKQAGIVIDQAQGGVISNTSSLTGRIILNRDTSASIRARFPGIVRDVPVRLGQSVEKGQVLARIESNESLKDYNVTAPVSGVILSRNTNVGDVAGDEELFTIADLSAVWAKFHIFPKDTPRIQEGQTVRVHTLDEKVEASASIKLLLPTADALSQTHIAIVELDNADGHWRPGVTVEGDVAVSEMNASIAIPKTALQNMEEQTVVFVKNGDAYEMRPVKTGKSDGTNVEILSGLKAGESYVRDGSFIIKADIMKSGAAHEH